MFNNLISSILSIGFDYIAMIIFVIVMSIILYKNRKKLATQGSFPLFYIFLYRTKLGIKKMKRIADRNPGLVKLFGSIGVVVGFLGMLFIVDFLLMKIVQIFTEPAAAAAVQLVLPIKAKGIFYVPFMYWIISIFVILVVHEMSHGILSNVYKVPVKSSGLAVMGIGVPLIPAAFVEPDEAVLKTKKPWQQLSVYAAGPFSNIVLGLLILLSVIFVFNPIAENFMSNDGVIITSIYNDSGAYASNVGLGEKILFLNDVAIDNSQDLSKALKNKGIGEEVNLVTNISSYDITLGSAKRSSESLFMHSLNKLNGNTEKAFIGVGLYDNVYLKEDYVSGFKNILIKIYSWFLGLIMHLFMLNLGIGLFNLMPLGIVDGGRMFQIVLLKIFKTEKQKKLANKIWGIVGLILGLFLVYMIISGFIR